MRHTALLLTTLALAITRATAQAIDVEDVPSSCQSACAPVVGASDVCEESESDEDAGDWVCVCAASGMQTAIPECLACVQSAPASGEEDDDGEGGKSCRWMRPMEHGSLLIVTAADIVAGMQSCGFSAAAPAGSSAAAGGTSAQAPISSNAPVTETIVATGGGGGGAATTQVTVSGGDGSGAGTTQVTVSGEAGTAATPGTTAGPSQGTGGGDSDDDDSDLGGSRLTVITTMIGSGNDAQMATLTSVVPGPVVTSDVAAEQQSGNAGATAAMPAAAAALGFAAAFL